MIITYFKAPKSYTGQEMIEINCHGGLATVKKISITLEDLGARLAAPGEFTKRALINNKINSFQKDDQTVLTANGQIVWVCGHRIDDSVKLKNSTEKILRVTRKLK